MFYGVYSQQKIPALGGVKACLRLSGSMGVEAYHEDSGAKVVAWARIDNRQQLSADLPSEFAVLIQSYTGQSDAGLLLAAYLHWGEACTRHLIGDFAFAVSDPRSGQLFLARDHIGVRPLYYVQHGQQTYFAASVPDLRRAIAEATQRVPTLAMPVLPLNEAWLARYIVLRSDHWQETPFDGVYKVPPAHSLLVTSQYSGQPQAYFTFSREADLQLDSDDAYLEAYQEVLFEAVRCRVPQQGPVGSELSGGLDSSTVTAVASRCMGSPRKDLHCLGYAHSQLVAEAMAAVAQTSSVAMTHFTTFTNNYREPMQRFWEISGMPLEHENGMSHYPIYKQCQQLGIDVLLSGFGGDEFVTNAAPTALVEFWNDGDYGLFFSRQRGNWLTKPLHTLRWWYLYYRYQNQSVVSRRLQSNGQKLWPHIPLTNEVIERFDLHNLFMDPLRYDGGQLTQNDFSLNNRWSPQMTSRLENCSLAAAHYGIDYRWPLLDIRLLKLFLSIPASQKLGPGSVGRYLHRRATAFMLPSLIAWGPKELVEENWLKRLLLGKFHTDKIHQKNALPQRRAPASYRQRQQKRRQTLSAKAASPPAPVETNKPQLHAQLMPLVDLAKLERLKQKVAVCSESERMLYNSPLSKLNILDGWLKYNASLEKPES